MFIGNLKQIVMDPLRQMIEGIKQQVEQKYIKEDYKICYVAFLDILGMKNLLKKDYSEIRKIFNTVESALVLYCNTKIEGKENFISKKQIHVTVMSDSIVLSVEKDTKNSFSKILGISSYIIQEILNALDEPVFIRGGLSVGKLSHTQFSVFGPGLSKAYNLENEKADYMRCIIDKDIYDSHDFIEYKKENTSLIKDKDDFYFIDFIREGNQKRIKEYAKKVIQQQNDKKILNKYKLLIEYINRKE